MQDDIIPLLSCEAVLDLFYDTKDQICVLTLYYYQSFYLNFRRLSVTYIAAGYLQQQNSATFRYSCIVLNEAFQSKYSVWL